MKRSRRQTARRVRDLLESLEIVVDRLDTAGLRAPRSEGR